MTAGPQTLDSAAIEELRGRLRGPIFTPAEPGYDGARAIWNGAFDGAPGVVAQATGVADVVTVVDVARESNALLAVRGGGHSVPGHSVCDGGIVLDLSPMRGIRVDPGARTAHAQGGVSWGLFDRETGVHGLGVTGGQVTDTGIAGLTLGGGIGWLMRKHGLTCDNVLSIDLVTADGTVLTASESENADLFWGLRGGGGNFGVATSFEYRLHPVGTVLAGAVLHSAERAEDVLRFYREFVADAPDELTAYAIFFTAPPAPFIPPEVQGSLLLALAACYCGEIEQGEKVLEPLRRYGSPGVDLFQPMPYTVIQSMFDDSAPRGRSYYISGDYFSELTDDLLATLVDAARNMPGPHCEIHLGQMGGSISRVPEDATAFGHRDAEFVFIDVAGWDDPGEADAHRAWSKGLAGAVREHAAGVYVNFLADEGEERIKFAYGADKYERLRELKRRYDPGNLFRLNQNIKP